MSQPFLPLFNPPPAQPDLLKPERVQVMGRARGHIVEPNAASQPACVCAEAAPVLPFEASEPSTIRTRYRLRLEVESTVPYEAGAPIREAEDILGFLWRSVFAGEPREVLTVVFVDARNRPIGHQIAFTGGIARCIAEPRHILVTALLCNAVALFVAHNHPSGDLQPSTEDVSMTGGLAKACDALSIRLLDSLIVGHEQDGFRWRSIMHRRTGRVACEALGPSAKGGPRA
jgi:DNA repair protein RadC